MSSAPPSWTIEKAEGFLKDLKRLAKSLYKSDRQRIEFADYLSSLYLNWGATGLPVSAPPMQGFSLPEGTRLHKVYLNPPGTRGASGEMRVLALVQEEQRRIALLMAYTHAEYESQPPKREIQRRIEEAL